MVINLDFLLTGPVKEHPSHSSHSFHLKPSSMSPSSAFVFSSSLLPGLSTLSSRSPVCNITNPHSPSVPLIRSEWTKVATRDEVKQAGGKKVVVVGGQKILLVDFENKIYAVSNKCTHLGLPLEGKVLKANITPTGCVVCAAHNTAFDLKTGQVKGEWAEKFPNLPFVGKGKKETALPTFQSQVDAEGNIEIDVY